MFKRALFITGVLKKAGATSIEFPLPGSFEIVSMANSELGLYSISNICDGVGMQVRTASH